MNPTASILKYMSEMDIEMLSLILDENKTYQDATKDVFLNKLKGAFETFKNEKDQKLNYYPGVCNSSECTNTGCKGYTFVGDTSGASLDLIFDEKNGEVNDIYYCNSMSSDSPKLEEPKTVSLHFWADEQADFVPTPEYLYQVQLADKASEEIIFGIRTENDFINLIQKIDTRDIKINRISYNYFDFNLLKVPFKSLTNYKNIKDNNIVLNK